MRKLVILAVICLGAAIFLFLFKRDDEPKLPTEFFIEEWLKNSNDTLATYVSGDEAFEIDTAHGREALSESIGLWMEYGVEKGDPKLFESAFQALNAYFVDDDGFVYWKLSETGVSQVYTNALVDDLRIINALFTASEKWDEEKYKEMAVKISQSIETNNYNQGILTDFYEQQYNYSSDEVTLSYIEPEAIELMEKQGLLDGQTAEGTIEILRKAPVRNGFYPKSYSVATKSYQYDSEIHMVDQALVAHHLSKLGIVSNEFHRFVEDQMENGVIYGRYHLESRVETVPYESPAVYGFLIMYCLEVGEDELADALYNRMIQFRNSDKGSPYYGGYSVDKLGNTHIFDNLVPLLAELRYHGDR